MIIRWNSATFSIIHQRLIFHCVKLASTQMSGYSLCCLLCKSFVVVAPNTLEAAIHFYHLVMSVKKVQKCDQHFYTSYWFHSDSNKWFSSVSLTVWSISMACDKHRRLMVGVYACLCMRSVVLNFMVWWVFMEMTDSWRTPQMLSALISAASCFSSSNSLTLITCHCPGWWRSLL